MHKKDIGHLIKLISDGVRSTIDTHVKKYDLTCSQLRALGYIDRNGGRVTQKQLEDFLEVSHPTVVGLINRLEKNGFVKCHFDEKNKKRKIVFADEKAEALSEDMAKNRIQTEEMLLNGLSAEEIAELERLLNIVYENVKTKNQER